LVLGGTGNVGQYVVQWLQQHADPHVKILMGRRSSHTLLEKTNVVKAVACDLSNPSSIKAAVCDSNHVGQVLYLFSPNEKDLFVILVRDQACIFLDYFILLLLK
jgi:uncharacterized protein YbjT (DUF2867 family)